MSISIFFIFPLYFHVFIKIDLSMVFTLFDTAEAIKFEQYVQTSDIKMVYEEAG